jgi:predicted dehydrogenase
MEAFHWRYHPLAARMRSVLASGELGAVRHVEARFCVPLVLPGDIRFRRELAGGATMDTGCYAVHIVRTLAGAEPEVVRAEARLSSPGSTAGYRRPAPPGARRAPSAALLSHALRSAGGGRSTLSAC